MGIALVGTLLQLAARLMSVHGDTGLSVVIPVGPGDVLAPGLRRQLADLPAEVQVRVVYADNDPAVDSGRDGALESRPNWRVCHAPRGRATQQNAGARQADGEWLWFLHADSRLADSSLVALRSFIARNSPAVGYHELRYLADGPAWMRLTELGAWLRSHVFGLPFGDQGLLMPRGLFLSIGGFDPDLTRGEDHELIWRLRRAGIPVLAVGANLFTSARRYAECGWWPTTFLHLRETLRQAWRFSRAGMTQ